MLPAKNVTPPLFWATAPLVPAAALFLSGLVIGQRALPGAVVWALACVGWVGWIACEVLARPRLAHGALALLLVSAGALVWTVNQTRVPAAYIARLAPVEGQTLIALRAKVLAAPADSQAKGNRYFVARAQSLYTARGWMPASGDLLIKWSGGSTQTVSRDAAIELYGWLSRPEAAKNPGGLDPRRQLAADRIFAQVHVPHASGVVTLDASDVRGDSWLNRFRVFIRGKLLEHTLDENVPSALTLSALLLGHRDPAISEVSQSFADAGVAHLLAISGSHIVFFTAMVWAVLRFIPLRPRVREVLIAAVVGIYVLATPCGPPIVRAAVALLMVVLARLMGRPRHYLNMLAAAVVVVVLLRPADIRDAGFQLTFVTTAGLILLASRVHAALAGPWLAREALAGELSQGRWQRVRLRGYQLLAAVFVANLIGALAAAPLVAFHFGQFNLWAPVSGILALPAVSLGMIAAAVQLVAEILWPPLGALFSPISTGMGRVLIASVHVLATLPASAIALRAPPIWAIGGFYLVMVLWIVRRRLALSRALIVNAMLAVLVAASAWYALTVPVGSLRLNVLSADNASCILLRGPRGDLWLVNAGSSQGTSTLTSALRPALRVEGRRRVDGALFTALDAAHAGEAAAALDAYPPGRIWLSEPAWEARQQTLAGNQLDSAARRPGLAVRTLGQGETLDLGEGASIECLWPPAHAPRPAPLILLMHCAGHHLLLADPAAIDALAQVLLNRPGLRCDAVILVGPQRGTADAPLLRLLEPLAAETMVWTGRGPWSPRTRAGDQLNAADGAISLEITSAGITITSVNADH